MEREVGSKIRSLFLEEKREIIILFTLKSITKRLTGIKVNLHVTNNVQKFTVKNHLNLFKRLFDLGLNDLNSIQFKVDYSLCSVN